MHESALQFEPVGAAWRQQALRVVRTPRAALSTLPLGAVELIPARTFAQHGVLGDPHALVLSFAIRNRGADVAPLVDIAVNVTVPGATFEDGEAVAGWEDGFGWTHTATRMGTAANITLTSAAMLRDGAVAAATFRLQLQPGTDLSRTPLEVTASGYADVPHRPALPTALTVPVERVEF